MFTFRLNDLKTDVEISVYVAFMTAMACAFVNYMLDRSHNAYHYGLAFLFVLNVAIYSMIEAYGKVTTEHRIPEEIARRCRIGVFVIGLSSGIATAIGMFMDMPFLSMTAIFADMIYIHLVENRIISKE